jgi:hypothetical protein
MHAYQRVQPREIINQHPQSGRERKLYYCRKNVPEMNNSERSPAPEIANAREARNWFRERRMERASRKL